MSTRARVRLPAGGEAGTAITVAVGIDGLPCKEWSIVDDVLNIADSASFTVANIDGENSGKFYLGQRIEIDLADDSVASGKWIRQFTGRVTSIRTHSDAGGGSAILVGAMDLGWHLTSCHAEPLKNIKGIKFSKLIEMLIHPSWGFGPVQFDGDRNTRLKHGRQITTQNFNVQLRAILPFIQVEPGQAPFDLLHTYAQREGLLINVGARGELLLFRPNYTGSGIYSFEYHPVSSPQSALNNIKGRPEVSEDIDGIYTETQCWSTTVIPPQVQDSTNPNEMYRHSVYRPTLRPLPFERRHVFSDGEAINNTLRKNRAIWKYQMGQFQSWQYEIEVEGHAQGGGFFVSNVLASINDTVNKVHGAFYVQRVQRSHTVQGGAVSRLLIRKPGLLDPDLDSLKVGAGVKRAMKKRKVVE